MAKVKIKNPKWVVKKGDLITLGNDRCVYMVLRIYLACSLSEYDAVDLVVLYSPNESILTGNVISKTRIVDGEWEPFKGEVIISNY